MGRKSFEAYGALASLLLSETQQAGRYSTQAKDERRIAPDVARKLRLSKTDTLMDIGCGPGLVTRMVARRVRRVVALDHPNTIRHLRRKVQGLNISLIAGEFLATTVSRKFDKVLIYSVVQYLASRSEALAFIDKAADLLKPGGMMLVGDLPNVDMRRRFNESPAGKRFNKIWQRNRGAAPIIEDDEKYSIDDTFVVEVLLHFRSKGFQAWVMAQTSGLPFAFTREDLLLVRP